MKSPTEKGGEPTKLIEPTEEWEKRHRPIVEGPFVFREGARYYLVYSGSRASSPDYAAGYAVSDSPTGPFQKYAGNPIMKRDDAVLGPGHGSVIRDGKGRLWYIYHQQNTTDKLWDRFICMDPMSIDESGVLRARATRGLTQAAPCVLSVERTDSQQTNRTATAGAAPAGLAP